MAIALQLETSLPAAQPWTMATTTPTPPTDAQLRAALRTLHRYRDDVAAASRALEAVDASRRQVITAPFGSAFALLSSRTRPPTAP